MMATSEAITKAMAGKSPVSHSDTGSLGAAAGAAAGGLRKEDVTAITCRCLPGAFKLPVGRLQAAISEFIRWHYDRPARVHLKAASAPPLYRFGSHWHLACFHPLAVILYQCDGLPSPGGAAPTTGSSGLDRKYNRGMLVSGDGEVLSAVWRKTLSGYRLHGDGDGYYSLNACITNLFSCFLIPPLILPLT